MKLNKNGFALTELLVVVVVLAFMVAIAVPIFNSEVKKNKQISQPYLNDVSTFPQTKPNSLGDTIYYQGGLWVKVK